MFIPRHPVVENQFCHYTTQSGTGTAGVGGVVCYAGAVVYLVSSATNGDAIVSRYDTYTKIPTGDTNKEGSGTTVDPFGFAMQKVKTGYHQVHPAGYSMPGDLGSSDVIAQPWYNASGAIIGTKQAPLGVAHLGVWDTVHYVCEHTANVVSAGNQMKPGHYLHVACNNESRVTNVYSNAGSDVDTNYKAIDRTFNVARVMKGASAAKCSATIANTTLYPIRIKLLI
jgi:hypothetical protein